MFGDAKLATVHETLGPILAETAARSRRPFGLVEKLPTRANRACTRNLARLDEVITLFVAGHETTATDFPNLPYALVTLVKQHRLSSER